MAAGPYQYVAANNVTGDSELAGLGGPSGTSKRPSPDNEGNSKQAGLLGPDHELLGLAQLAQERRILIREKIRTLDQGSHHESDHPFPNTALQLSNPAFETKFPFLFVGFKVPERFQVNPEDVQSNWFYMGREKFTELLDRVKKLRIDSRRSDLTLYGTRGYGKTHLLAAYVCYLAAGDDKIVYIPDCKMLFEAKVSAMRAAMLFAWADDVKTQRAIMKLNTQEEIDKFFETHPDVIFVFDQLNSIEKKERDDERTMTKKADLRQWLQGLRSPVKAKAILSSSANNHSILNEARKLPNNENIMYAYNGLTRVSLGRNNLVFKKGLF